MGHFQFGHGSIQKNEVNPTVKKRITIPNDLADTRLKKFILQVKCTLRKLGLYKYLLKIFDLSLFNI